MSQKKESKQQFFRQLHQLVQSLNGSVSTPDGQWTIKGFIDIYKNIYTISSDTKIVSKILEIHLFPQILQFAEHYGYGIVLPDHQNYYPDLSFVQIEDPSIKFALDLKTTYRLPESPDFCNGFTLGSHGEYFQHRDSQKNIQFPYCDYLAHYCLGILYTRTFSDSPGALATYTLDQLHSIASVIHSLQFFVTEKWRIASDKSGSGNTANIGSIHYIPDLLSGNGMFRNLGESWFDDYWMNYGAITTTTPDGRTKKITTLEEFISYRGGDPALIVKRPSKPAQRRKRI